MNVNDKTFNTWSRGRICWRSQKGLRCIIWSWSSRSVHRSRGRRHLSVGWSTIGWRRSIVSRCWSTIRRRRCRVVCRGWWIIAWCLIIILQRGQRIVVEWIVHQGLAVVRRHCAVRTDWSITGWCRCSV